MSRQVEQWCGVRARQMIVTTRAWAWHTAWVPLIIAMPLVLSGCAGIFPWPFTTGTYVGDLPCMLSVVDPSGSTGEQDFTTTVTLTIDADGDFSINGVEIVLGAEVIRSTPSADLSYEVTKINRIWGVLTVEYVPRPTLAGITVEGDLVETYRWHFGSIRAEGRTDLQVTDVSGTSDFTGICNGVLARP